MTVKKLTALGGDIFAGLFTVGVKRAGYQVLGHLEHGPYGVATAELNHPELRGRIWTHPSRWPEPKTFGKVNLMFCNPPCAAWSSARVNKKGSWEDHTERLGIIDNLATYGIELGCDAWCWESVTNAWRHGRGFMDRIAEAWLDAGYSVTVLKQNNMYLGVPQNRPRVLVTAHKRPLVLPPLREPITVAQALKGIRPTKEEIAGAQFTAGGWKECWEQSAGHGKMRRAWLGMSDSDRKKITRRPGFFSRRVLPDQPAPVNLDRTNQLHPFEPRMFTWKEQLALCGLPLDFQGSGGGNGADFIQLSRAVMPPVGEWLALAVRDGLDRRAPRYPTYRVIHLDNGPDKIREEELMPDGDPRFGPLRSWRSATPEPVRVVRGPRPAAGPSAAHGQGIGAFMRERILAGDDTETVLRKTRETFPSTKATASDVSWNRGRLRREGALK